MLSCSSIICIARGFGAPDNVPAGKTAKSASTQLDFSARVPLTVETICITCEYLSMCIKSITSTLPGSQILPRSLRPRSTSIKCSALSFGSASNSSANFASNSGDAERFLVPAMG